MQLEEAALPLWISGLSLDVVALPCHALASNTDYKVPDLSGLSCLAQLCRYKTDSV